MEPEHAGTHNLSSDPLEVGRGVFVVDAGRSFSTGVMQNPLTESAGGRICVNESAPVRTERILRSCVRRRGETIQRDIQVNSNSHGEGPLRSVVALCNHHTGGEISSTEEFLDEFVIPGST
ncbi:hypothetical protein AHiyo1_23700 [Arthrobacter sp. Hiyo1]|nr:hypothetical protein AHiyo1_23700 [Arthrobacter sp. Hiyo1]